MTAAKCQADPGCPYPVDGLLCPFHATVESFGVSMEGERPDQFEFFGGLRILRWASGAAAVGAWTYYRRREPRGILTHLLALAQTLLVAQVGIGLLLLSSHHRAADHLHYLYGTLSLLAVLSPWLYAPTERRGRLAWFTGATLVAGALAVRAYMTAT